MGKKILIGIGSGLIAVVLIVAITFLSIIYTRDFEGSIEFGDKVYNEDFDASLDGVTINVASYNIKSGYNTKDNLVKIREQLALYDIDIAGLQEIDTDKMPRSKKLSVISTLTQGRYANHFFSSTDSLFLGANYGIMNVSDSKMLEEGKVFLPMASRMFMLIGEPRVCIRNVVNIDGVDIAFYNTHLSFENGIKTKDKKEMRTAQIEYIMGLMDQDPCEYKVLVGDFNILNFGELEVFTRSGKYSMLNNQSTAYKSYRGDDVDFVSLDNIIYTNNMQLVKGGMVDNDLSDHNMLYASLKIIK